MNSNLDNGIGVLTLAKFHHNRDGESDNYMVTRTLGKFGIISKNYRGIMPQEDEFWLTRIVDNIKPNERVGCFIVEPVYRVEYAYIGKLLKGMYEELPNNNPLLLFVKPQPNFRNHVWQLSLEDRKTFKNRAVIVIQDEQLLSGDFKNAKD